MCSRSFDILHGQMKKILGCLRYILEVTESRSPKSTLERHFGYGYNNEVDESDPLLNLDDNKYMNPPVDWEDEEDDF